MSNINETADWTPAIKLTETTEEISGGPDGNLNIPFIQLANRTLHLKNQYDTLVSKINQIKTLLNVPVTPTEPVGGLVKSITATNASQPITQVQGTDNFTYMLTLNPPSANTTLNCKFGGTVNFNTSSATKVDAVFIDDVKKDEYLNYRTSTNGSNGWGEFNIPIPAGASTVNVIVSPTNDYNSIVNRIINLTASGVTSANVSIINVPSDTTPKYYLHDALDVNVGPAGGTAIFYFQVNQYNIPAGATATLTGRMRLMYGTQEKTYDLGQVVVNANEGDVTASFTVPNYSADVASLGSTYAQMIVDVISVKDASGNHLCTGSNWVEALWGSVK